MTEIGDTVVRIEQLIQETQSFQQSCEMDVERAMSVIENGRSIIENNDKSSSKDTVEPKCSELNRMLEMFNEKVSKREDTLTNAHRLMERVEKANEWCAKGIDFLASQRIENASLSPDIAEQKLKDIQSFVESAEDFEISSLKDLKNCQEENTSLETIILSQVSLIYFSLVVLVSVGVVHVRLFCRDNVFYIGVLSLLKKETIFTKFSRVL